MVSQELERVAVKHIGAGLGHGIDSGSRMHAVLSRQTTGGHPELLQRIRERKR